MNCEKPFDGHGGELAHSWTAGDVHFDEDENYKRDDPTGTGINLLKVATCSRSLFRRYGSLDQNESFL